ncbi:hypothetical protein HC931_19680 [Candidatus Gracilibacteria bacterium]|nr:hypothetical protein [Candidatus Gracilibacteria bacterium]NJM88906.1 hypothetical protein [Hydrococcus sp. RU_2_2]NJP19856.1 hypothetical protein [Hydrococcus sp. CRU_1_1]NJQ97959.1 hypothetical protein [Hydrococcus sp. CSU_1_8]
MPAITEAVESLETLLHDLQPDEVELVASTLKRLQKGVASSPEDALIEALAGRTYSREEKIQLELESLFRYFERRRQLLEGALTAAQVAKLLGTSRQTPHDRMKSQTLLGVLDRGAYRFPVIQFDPEAPDGVIDGLPEVLKVLEVSDLAKLSWLVRPNPILDGLTPVQALKKGLKERVIAEARGVGIL